MRSYDNRRLRVYHVDPNKLLNYFRSAEHWPDYIEHEIVKDLPEGAELLEVQYRMDSRSLAVLVTHPSFPQVPCGERIPEAPGFLETERVVLKRQPDGSYRGPGVVALSADPSVKVGMPVYWDTIVDQPAPEPADPETPGDWFRRIMAE